MAFLRKKKKVADLNARQTILMRWSFFVEPHKTGLIQTGQDYFMAIHIAGASSISQIIKAKNPDHNGYDLVLSRNAV
jgi:hypothetical protein